MHDLLLLILNIQDFHVVFSIRIDCIITKSYFIVIVAKQTWFSFEHFSHDMKFES